MKSYILPLILAGLFLQGCSSNNADTAQSGKNNQSSQSGQSNPNSQGTAERPPLQAQPVKPKDDSLKPPRPPADGRTAEALYNHLKSKGWQINDFKPVQLHMFSSEESASFKDDKNIGYVIMRYENPEKARENFSAVDDTYRQKFGRALISQNFVVAVFGIPKGKINKPEIIELGEQAYKELQTGLDDFVKTPRS